MTKQVKGEQMKYMQKNEKEIEEYILNIHKFRKEGSIEQAAAFYEFLGKPGKNSTIVHVAGTNGKGSVCAYMNSVLTEAGYKVGMFTSPHLVTIRERMRINRELISKQEFIDCFQRLMEQIDKYNKGNEVIYKISEEDTRQEWQSCYIPTFFEFLFFMATLYFENHDLDVIILETGLGGRLDATNVIESPKVAVITEIGKDHCEYLGETYEKIAEEKAGIIKEGSKVVYSSNRQESAMVIERKAKELGVLCKCVEKIEKQDFSFVDKKIDFSYYSRYYEYITIRLNTCAVYQVENARIALTALEELDLEIPLEAMQKGMFRCRWEGRMEEILPGVYLDGAHNEDGIDALIFSVRQDGCEAKRWLLFSVVADKEYEIMKEKLIKANLFDYIYAASLKTARGLDKKSLENMMADHGVRVLDSVYQGFQEILSLKAEKDLVYITGSLYLVGEIKEQFGGNND